MANQSEKYISQTIAFGDNTSFVPESNSPSQYKSRQRQYLANRTSLFNATRAYLATDYVEANVQGTNPDNFYEWLTTYIRLADISKLSANASKKADDYKIVLFPQLGISYVAIGAKIQTMGSTWIVINPQNISSPSAKTIVARCNASYNSYDYYGNVITEPLVVEKYAMLGNDNANSSNMVLMDGYFNVTCQLNSNTQNLKQNSRLILGNKAYHITGITDFIQEFSGDRNSCHLLSFTVRLEEPTEYDDVCTNFIANGNNYSFGATVNGVSSMKVGQQQAFTATFLQNGVEISSTTAYPLTWQWRSSNNLIATVNENGVVAANTTGNCQIIASLLENPNVYASFDLSVEEAQTTSYTAFNGFIPQSITQFETVTINAAYYQNGEITDFPLTWSFAGAKNCYIATTAINTLSTEIMCVSPSSEPLTITVEYDGITSSIQIALEGY